MNWEQIGQYIQDKPQRMIYIVVIAFIITIAVKLIFKR